MHQRRSWRGVALALFVLTGSIALVSAQSPAKKPVTHD